MSASSTTETLGTSQIREVGETQWERRLGALYPNTGNITIWVLALAGFFYVLLCFKVLPGHAPTAQYLTSDTTFAECFHKTRALGMDECRNFGFPKGSTKTFGLPVSIIGSYMAKGGSVALTSILLVYASFILTAYIGAIALFRRFTGVTWLSIVGALLYLGSATIYKFSEYGALGLGIALIPLYLLIDLRFLDSLSSGSRLRMAVWFAVAVAARYFAIFLDGYSFLFSCALSLGCLLLTPAIEKKFGKAAVACVAYLLACAIAAFAYSSYFPRNALGSTPLSGFRAQGVDTYGLISPQPDNIYNRWFGLGGNIDPLVTYSDGSSSNGIFLGYAWIVAAIVLGVFLVRKRASLPARHLFPILLAGFAALILSFGPSLKFKSFRDAPVEAITAAHYNMPESAAVMSLPTAWIYQKVPGVKTARALVRWLTLTRLALAILIVIAVLVLLQNRKPLLALSLAGLSLLELLPNFSTHLDHAKFAYARAYTLYYGYPTSLKRYVKPGERALFLELQDRPGGNQYVVNTLCTRAFIYCYNTGGDKASIMVQRYWPIDVLDAKNARHRLIAIRRIFDNHLADVIVVPFFDLKLAAYSEAQGAIDIDKVVKSVQSIADDLNLSLVVGDRYASLRPDPKSAASASTFADRCSLSCWRSWPEMPLPIPQWGPKKAIPGKPVNQQPDGRSLLWVRVEDMERSYALALGDTLLATQSSKEVITGIIPVHMTDSLIPGARYPLYLLDTKSEEKLLLGYINIAGLGQ